MQTTLRISSKENGIHSEHTIYDKPIARVMPYLIYQIAQEVLSYCSFITEEYTKEEQLAIEKLDDNGSVKINVGPVRAEICNTKTSKIIMARTYNFGKGNNLEEEDKKALSDAIITTLYDLIGENQAFESLIGNETDTMNLMKIIDGIVKTAIILGNNGCKTVIQYITVNETGRRFKVICDDAESRIDMRLIHENQTIQTASFLKDRDGVDAFADIATAIGCIMSFDKEVDTSANGRCILADDQGFTVEMGDRDGRFAVPTIIKFAKSCGKVVDHITKERSFNHEFILHTLGNENWFLMQTKAGRITTRLKDGGKIDCKDKDTAKFIADLILNDQAMRFLETE